MLKFWSVIIFLLASEIHFNSLTLSNAVRLVRFFMRHSLCENKWKSSTLQGIAGAPVAFKTW